jgi:hypothetical protein
VDKDLVEVRTHRLNPKVRCDCFGFRVVWGGNKETSKGKYRGIVSRPACLKLIVALPLKHGEHVGIQLRHPLALLPDEHATRVEVDAASGHLCELLLHQVAGRGEEVGELLASPDLLYSLPGLRDQALPETRVAHQQTQEVRPTRWS